MKYRFWGWEHADAKAITAEYKGIETPVDLYDALSHVWCADTCAPRMRQNWTKENMTLGQCSITAFWRRISSAVKCTESSDRVEIITVIM